MKIRAIQISRFITTIAVPLVMFPAIFYLQVTLGYEVGLFPLYLLPIAKLSWEFGWKGAMVGVAAATGLWLLANTIARQPFSSEWLRYYNAGIRGIVFASAAVFIMMFRRVVDEHRRRMEAMRSLLNVCHGCGAVQGSDGRWVGFEALLKQETRPQTCECPSCSTKSTNEKA